MIQEKDLSLNLTGNFIALMREYTLQLLISLNIRLRMFTGAMYYMLN